MSNRRELFNSPNCEYDSELVSEFHHIRYCQVMLNGIPYRLCGKTTFIQDLEVGEGDSISVHPSYVNKILKTFRELDLQKFQHMFDSNSGAELKYFLKCEMHLLKAPDSPSYVRYLRSNLKEYENLEESDRPITMKFLKERCFWFRRFNIFIFGVRQCREGDYHHRLLKTFIYSKEVRVSSKLRKQLRESYLYIFSRYEHLNFNYKAYLNRRCRLDRK